MEKTISIRNTEITFSIWDLGGQREFVNMLPLVCNDAVAILFMFDLTRKSTLNSIKEWYRQGRGFNKTAIPFLVGTKYDHFVNFPREEQEEISNQVCKLRQVLQSFVSQHPRDSLSIFTPYLKILLLSKVGVKVDGLLYAARNIAWPGASIHSSNTLTILGQAICTGDEGQSDL